MIDRPVWTANSDAWEICRLRRNTLFLNAQMWRAVNGNLPFDEVVQGKGGFQLASFYV